MTDVDKFAKILWEYNKLQQELAKADAILTMGSMDLRVADKAAELWHNGLAPVVIASGGFGSLTSSRWEESEADKFAAFCGSSPQPVC